jgi:hypothetical protein
MVDRRPRMWRSRRNATVLLFTCLIRGSDGSCMNSLFLTVGCLVFLYKQPWPSTVFQILLPVRRLFPLLVPVLLLQTQGRATPLQHQPGRRPRSCLAKVQFVPPPPSPKAKGVPASAHLPCLFFPWFQFIVSAGREERWQDQTKESGFSGNGWIDLSLLLPLELPGD